MGEKSVEGEASSKKLISILIGSIGEKKQIEIERPRERETRGREKERETGRSARRRRRERERGERQRDNSHEIKHDFFDTRMLLIRYVTSVFMPLMTANDSNINPCSFTEPLANYSLTLIMV